MIGVGVGVTTPAVVHPEALPARVTAAAWSSASTRDTAASVCSGVGQRPPGVWTDQPVVRSGLPPGDDPLVEQVLQLR